MRYRERCQRLVAAVALAFAGAAACTMSFPSADSEGQYACKNDKDCLSGYTCVEGFCSAHGGGGDDNGGGDNTVPGDNAPPEGQFNLQVTLTGTGSGTVTSTPARISCPSNCLAAFDENNTVTLTAVPGAGSFFGGFVGCTSATASTCSVLMSANKTVTVTFTTDTGGPAQNITNVVTGAGRVTGGGMTLDVQIGGGLAPTRASGTNTALEAGSNLHPKQQR